jgi:hypothetical protein
LVENGLGDRVALRSHEHFDKEGVGEVIACPNELGFGRAFSIDTLLFRFADEATTAERNDAACVAAHVAVDGEGCIDPGCERVEGVRT